MPRVTQPTVTVLSRKGVIDAVRAQGLDARDQDLERMLSERKFSPEPAKVADRYAYLPIHVEQLAAFVRSIRRRVPADQAKAAS